MIALLAACADAPPPDLAYRVARSDLALGSTAWNAPELPTDTLSILNLSAQSLLITPIGFEGEGASALVWRDFLDYTEVRPGDSVSLVVTLTADGSGWATGAWSPALRVEVGAAWNDPSDFDVAPQWYGDELVIPVAFDLACDLDGDGEDAVACEGADCDDAGSLETGGCR